jgi:hypothetical protein
MTLRNASTWTAFGLGTVILSVLLWPSVTAGQVITTLLDAGLGPESPLESASARLGWPPGHGDVRPARPAAPLVRLRARRLIGGLSSA